jgi:uncharacterized membrane protein
LLRVEETAWVGPLPSPEALARFNEVAPNGAERIIAEFEAEAKHRRKLETRAMTADVWDRLGGKVLAFAFSSIALIVAAVCALNGASTAAALIGTGTVGTVAVALIRGRPPSGPEPEK